MAREWTDFCADCGFVIELKHKDARADMKRKLAWHSRRCQIHFLINENLALAQPQIDLSEWWTTKHVNLGRETPEQLLQTQGEILLDKIINKNF